MTRIVYPHNPVRVVEASADQVDLVFELDTPQADWPWLTLPAQHPVLQQKLLYFASATALLASGRSTPDAPSALTFVKWSSQLGPDAPIPTRGHCAFASGPEGDRFELRLDDGALTFMGGGVAITDRDMAAWRAETRKKVLAKAHLEPPFPELPERMPPWFVRLEDGGEDGRFAARGLVTSERAFFPGHPFHTGSGDHVNVAHLVDCVAQVAELHLGVPITACTGGSGTFRRFVELDVPFVLQGTIEGRTVTADFTQVGYNNGRVELHFA
ncbi:MAG: hypothetical protein AAGA48_01525 [Myxococcota bacterium]